MPNENDTARKFLPLHQHPRPIHPTLVVTSDDEVALAGQQEADARAKAGTLGAISIVTGCGGMQPGRQVRREDRDVWFAKYTLLMSRYFVDAQITGNKVFPTERDVRNESA